MPKAVTLGDIKKSLDPEPLSREEIHEGLFVETWQARDPMVSRRDELADRLDTGDSIKVLLAGHRGTGKSTELVKFGEEHADRYAIIKFSIAKEAMLPEVRIEPLLVLTVEALLSQTQDHGVTLDEESLEKVYEWFSDTFKELVDERDATVRAGAGVDTKDTFWGKLVGLSASLRADIKAGCRVLNKRITKDNRRLSELVAHCDALIKEARIALASKDKELLLIIEDLDKCGLADADELFIQNPTPLACLSCKAVYTLPIWLLYSPKGSMLRNSFPVVTLPMIKVQEKDGNRCEQGMEAVREILSRRFDVGGLVDEDALNLAVEKTGGVLRHLFEVLITAALVASGKVKRGERTGEDAKLQKQDVEYGLGRLQYMLLNQRGTVGLPEEYREISTETIDLRLRKLVGKAERLAPDNINLLLIRAETLIEYNNEGWCRLHPLVEEYFRVDDEQ